MLLGFVLALMTLLAGISLLSLSGWFISATAFAGLTAATAAAFNYFLPAAGVRLFALTRIGSRYGERIVNHDVTFKILSQLRVWLYQHLEPLAPAYLLRFRSADLLTRMVSDINAMDNLFLRVVVPTMVSVLTIVLLGLFVSYFSLSIAVVIAVCLFLSLLILPVLGRFLARQLGSALLVGHMQLRTSVLDIVQGLPELLLAGQVERHIHQATIKSSACIELQHKMAKVEGLTSAVYVLLLGGALLGVAIFAVYDTHLKLLDGAIIALLLFAVMGAFEAIMPLPRAFQYLSETKTAGERLIAVKKESPAVAFVVQSAAQPQDGSIAFQNVSFGYQTTPLFEGVNCAIGSGEKLGIIGATGSGKSTLLHLIARSFDVSSGRIVIGGVGLDTLSETDLRAQMTMITQRVHIFNDTLRENLRIAKPNATDEELRQALEKVRLGDYVQQLKTGLNTWLGEAGMKLSGGQARRVALARAVLHDAPIWLLDEPTEGLDVATELQLLATLQTVTKNKTVVMVSHREAPLQYVDRIVAFDDMVQ